MARYSTLHMTHPTLHDRILAYLAKRKTWTPVEHITALARSTGYHTIAIRDALETVRNTRNIGYLHEKGYRYYDIPQEVLQRMEWMDKWWDSLPETPTPTSTKQSRHNV
jgi:hypothetical protein